MSNTPAGLAVPEALPVSSTPARRDLRRRRRGIRHRRRLRSARGGSRRCASAAAREVGRARRHVVDVRRPLLPRRRHGRAEGDRSRGLGRGDVRLPDGQHQGSRRREDPRLLRGIGRAVRLARGARLRVRALLLSPRRPSSSPAPRDSCSPATRRSSPTATRSSRRRAATRCRCPVTPRAPGS